MKSNKMKWAVSFESNSVNIRQRLINRGLKRTSILGALLAIVTFLIPAAPVFAQIKLAPVPFVPPKGSLAVLPAPAPAPAAAPAPAGPSVLFTNMNGQAVASGVAAGTGTLFTLKSQASPVAYRLTQVMAYFFNGGAGAAPGVISIWTTSRQLVFAGNAQGLPGQNGPNESWVVKVTPPVDLLPGTYILDVSNHAAWSHDPGSAGCLPFNPSFQCGMGTILGTMIGIQLKQQGGSNPVQQPGTGPYGGNCNGAGCTHPDLTAFGGCAPFPLLPACNVQINAPSSAYFFTANLTPTTSLPTLVAQCRRDQGTLVVIRDEYYYYYFSGFYAVLGCRR
jgi:hypothetical protein